MKVSIELETKLQAISPDNPAVPIEIMAQGYLLYRSVYHGQIEFQRTPEDIHSPLMADLRPDLKQLQPRAVDAALAVQRFLLLRGGDAIRFLSSFMNRAALLTLLERNPSWDSLHLPDRLPHWALLQAVATLPLADLLDADRLMAAAKALADNPEVDIEASKVGACDQLEALTQVIGQLASRRSTKTLH